MRVGAHGAQVPRPDDRYMHGLRRPHRRAGQRRLALLLSEVTTRWPWSTSGSRAIWATGGDGSVMLSASDCAGFDLASPTSGPAQSARYDAREYQCRQHVVADAAVVALPLAIQ